VYLRVLIVFKGRGDVVSRHPPSLVIDVSLGVTTRLAAD
jgi:hypothetical protein